MMGVSLGELAVFSLIWAFAPGPNNLVAMSQSLLFGFRRTQPFVIGVCIGVFIILLLCALFSAALLSAWQGAEQTLRIIGALYILWLAWSIISSATARLEGDTEDEEVLTFERGLFLQFVNPKLILIGLTVFSGFFGSILSFNIFILLAVLVFTAQTYIAVSLWAIAGQAISQFLAGRVASIIISMVLALMLAVIAYNLSGIEAIIRGL
jgi:cysteine/O-acetylserine efflux protein